MSLSERLDEYVRACFSGIWIESHEHQDAIVAIAELCSRESWRLATWDIEQGLSTAGAHVDAPDPLAAVRSLSAMATTDGTTLLVLQNFHRFLSSPEIVQAVIRAVVEGKQQRTFVIVLAPVVSLPIELDKLFVVIEHESIDKTMRPCIDKSNARPAGVSVRSIICLNECMSRLWIGSFGLCYR